MTTVLSELFIEVTQSGQVVWKYINPVAYAGPLLWDGTIPADSVHPGEMLNAVFRVYRYPLDYPAFNGLTLTPGGFIELYPSSVNETTVNKYHLSVSPNPFSSFTQINFTLPGNNNVEIQITDMMGKVVKQFANSFDAGAHTLTWNGADNSGATIASGIYSCRFIAAGQVETVKLVYTK